MTDDRAATRNAERFAIRTDAVAVVGAGETALVTGAAGFIGSHLCQALVSRGTTVVGIDSFDRFYARRLKEANLDRVRAAPSSGGSFVCHEADIVDASMVHSIVEETRPTVVFHLAALVGIQPSLAEPSRYVSVNLAGTTNMLEACRSIGCRRVVFASSSSVYGDSAPLPFREDDHADEPISPYAATKRGGELIAQVYASTFGLRIACLRYFTVFGPGQRPDLAITSFMRRMAAGETITLFGDGTSSRDYAYIDDIVDGTIAAGAWTAANAPCCRAFNLGGSHPVTLLRLVDAVACTVGVTPDVRNGPGRAGDVQRTWASLDRSGPELGYAPRISLEEGLQRQWTWLKSDLAAGSWERRFAAAGVAPSGIHRRNMG